MDLSTALRSLHLAAVEPADPAQVAAIVRRLVGALDVRVVPAFLHHAYWSMPEVPTAALADHVGSRARWTVGRGPLIGCCSRCGRGIRAPDRDALDAPPASRCHDCVGPDIAAERPDPSPTSGPGSPWEFEPAPAAWRRQDVVGHSRARRVWAEHYGDPSAA